LELIPNKRTIYYSDDPVDGASHLGKEKCVHSRK